ncbi:hypothetical protein [Actinoplanes sp. NPDC051851]|uniref:hypothetical protein n=1 Tax=Actinoplanes sp. NPDC051851 TaxID=3154753 RepID=UPI003438FF8D
MSRLSAVLLLLLSPAVLSPAVLSPAVLSPAVLSPAALAPSPAPSAGASERCTAEDHTPSVGASSGWPGDRVTMTFCPFRDGVLEFGDCSVDVATGTDKVSFDCGDVDEKDGIAPVVTFTVPEKARPGGLTLIWHYWYRAHEGLIAEEGAKGERAAGKLEFEVLGASFEVTPSASAGLPGTVITLSLRSAPAEVRITGCEARLLGATGSCGQDGRDWTITVPPPDGTEPSELSWTIRYRAGQVFEGEAPGVREFAIEPWPPPVFDVTTDRKTIGPAESVVVTFASTTAGVTVDTCSVTLVARVPCDPKTKTATVRIPADRSPGAAEMTWKLTYRTTRSGDQGDGAEGTVAVEVVTPPRQFVVTIEPAAAAPGEPLTLTFTSATEGVAITGCLAAFASTAGNRCRHSTRRWFAQTRVPEDAVPGTAVLRWGIAARNTAGAELSDNGALDYTVLAPPTVKPSRTTPTPTDRDQEEPTEQPTEQPTTEPTGVPTEDFAVTTDPESAAPGDPVVVAIAPVNPATEISGCTVAFSGHGDVSCRRSAGTWAATLTVPRRADPGILPLRWRAGSRTGTVDYEVLGGSPAAAFSVLPDPAAAPAGTTVRLAHTSLVEGVEITECSAGFSDDDMRACDRTPDGWVAELTIPASTPPGRTQARWRLAYQQTGGAGTATTNGLTLFEVLPPEPAPPDPPVPLLAKILLAVLALVLPLLLAPVRQRILDLFRRVRSEHRADDGADDDPARGVTAVVVDGPRGPVITAEDRERPAFHLVSVLPTIDPTIHEGVPR